MGRRTGYLIAVGIVVGAVALATFLVSLAPEPERREPPSQIPYVETAPIVAGSGAIPVYGAGTVRPSAEIEVAPQVGGRVVWVDPGFRSGGRVAAQQTLFRIEKADYQYRVREAEAALADKIAYYGHAMSPLILSRLGLTRTDFEPIRQAVHVAGDAELARSLVTPDMLRIGVAGSAGQLIARLESLADMGARHISFGPPLGQDILTAIETLGKQVLPHFRRWR